MSSIALTTYILGLIFGWFVAWAWYNNKYTLNIVMTYHDTDTFILKSKELQKIIEEFDYARTKKRVY